jgi:hypothetical protein
MRVTLPPGLKATAYMRVTLPPGLKATAYMRVRLKTAAYMRVRLRANSPASVVGVSHAKFRQT